MTSRLVIVGVPGEKRTEALLAAARRAGIETGCVPWIDAIAAPARVADAGGDVLRVESPGADAETWHALVRLGGDARSLAPGQWRPGRAWFAGLRRFLDALAAATPHLRGSSSHILAMTDKVVCRERLVADGVPVPAALPAVRAADELRAAMRAHQRSAVYVKPRWGSSGAGVLALRRAGDRECVITTARLVDGRLHNHKRLRAYRDRATIDALLGAVLGDGAVVERWIPKATTAGGPFDLRVLVVHGRVCQAVARAGRGTITNLHLDSRRVAVDDALAVFGSAVRDRVHDTCARAAACFPGHDSVGVDVMIDRRGRPFVLECNAWGDFLPGLLVDGHDSYDLYMRGLRQPIEDAS